ncbi:MAG: peptidoglycan DD-metalloendopeptidase family protein [Flectobacillus sp.]|uniref:peptidoglycan DD-metalloendopeptidase family protein n=1 Tax=Flectobacillus sp. TaxID=50419 RepID=UPI003B99BFAD
MLFEDILKKQNFASVVPFDLTKERLLKIDLTAQNADLAKIDLTDTAIFTEYVFEKIQKVEAVCAIGGYFENRYIYRRSQHFQQTEEARSIHLGVDIWAPAGTAVFAPIEGYVHSFANNDNFGDYGPTIILEHTIEGYTFYTLYGHLSLQSLQDLRIGQAVQRGQRIAEFGNFPENGNWPPHLHFQVMTDMLGKVGDFPGVCEPSKIDFYRAICPNAHIILKTDTLY